LSTMSLWTHTVLYLKNSSCRKTVSWG